MKSLVLLGISAFCLPVLLVLEKANAGDIVYWIWIGICLISLIVGYILLSKGK